MITFVLESGLPMDKHLLPVGQEYSSMQPSKEADTFDSQSEQPLSNIQTRRNLLRGIGSAGLVASAGCTGGESESGEDNFKLGLTAPLSGGNSLIGQNMQRALEIAVDEINDNDGLNGRQIDLSTVDDEDRPDAAVERVNQLINQDDVDLIIGAVSSAVRNSISPICESNEVPLLYPTQYEGTAAPDYCNPYLYKTGWVPTQQVTPSIPYLVEEYGSDFYLLGSDYLWPQEMNAAIRTEVENQGGSISGETYAELGATDFSSVLQSIQNEDPDVLMMTLVGASVPAIQNQLQNRDMRDNLTEVGLGHSMASLASLDADTAEGVINIVGYHNNMENELNQQFTQEFEDRYGDDDDALIDNITGGTYWTAKMMEQAASEGDGSVSSIRENFSGLTSDTIAGEISMVHDQQAEIGCVAAQVNSDVEFETIETFDPAMPEDACTDI